MKDRLEKLKAWRDLCTMNQVFWTGGLIEAGEFTYGRPVIHKWDGTTRLRIGKFCSIAGNVHILLGGEHSTKTLTTYPFDVLIDGKPTPSKGDVEIGNDVWIGENVTILSGVTIGDGAVIAAGSVVAKNVEPFAVAGGVPARFIRWRDQRFRYGMLRWWDWPIERIAVAMPILEANDLDALVEYWRGWREDETVFFSDCPGT